VFIIRGNLDAASERKCKIKANDCVPVELFFQEWQLEKASLTLPHEWHETLAEKLCTSLSAGSIPLEFILHDNGKNVRLTTKIKISLDAEVAQLLEKERIGVRLIP
jgi:hypothetical protein